MHWFRKRKPSLNSQAQRNIESVAQLEQSLRRDRTILGRVSDAVTNFVGSILFVIAHVILFVVWFVVNSSLGMGPDAFDVYPFQLLNLALAVEAVLLSTFVLMSQNRQSAHAEQWAHIGLQVNILAEQEATKMLQMLRAICDRLGMDQANDKVLKEMIETTQVELLAKELGKARKAEDVPPGAP